MRTPPPESVVLPSASPEVSHRLHGLDTLRALAILVVMPFHLSRHLPASLAEASQFGWIGVDLFFVLSGYLIAMQLLREQQRTGGISLGSFYRRRAYRILPAYLVVLGLYVFVPIWREAPGMQPTWQFLTFTENFLIDYARNRAFSHAWSLCVEEHFYLLFPAVALLLLRRPAAWKVYTLFGAIVVTGLSLRGFVFLHVLRPMGADDDRFGLLYLQRIYYPTYTRLDGLLAGVSLALLQTFRPRGWARLRRHSHSLMLGGVAVVAFALWSSHAERLCETTRMAMGDVFCFPLLALGFAALTASAVSENGLLARFRVPGAALLATLAFSLYLTHKEAVHLLLVVWPGAPERTAWTGPLYLAACLAMAGCLYLAVERPFMRLRDRSLRKRISVAQACTPTTDQEMRVDPAL